MKIHIKAKESALWFNGRFIDTNRDLDVPFSDALRLKLHMTVEAEFPKRNFNPETWKNRQLNFCSHIDTTSGWGNVTCNLLKRSPDIDWSVLGILNNRVNDPVFSRMVTKPFYEDGAMVWHEQPRNEWLYSPFGRNIAIVPWETTRIPNEWVARINSMDALLTTCEQNVQAFRDSGVTVPISIIHWGVDEALYAPIERPAHEIFTFGTMGALSLRKGTDLLIKAFQRAFPSHIKDVRLICKTSRSFYPFLTHDKRIVPQMGEYTYQEMRDDFFAKVDCFVWPSRGEGFGLPPLEAMATGLPVIATAWSGMLEYMKKDYGFLLDYDMKPAEDFSKTVYKTDCGEWAEPRLDHLVSIMRYAYEHRDEVKKMGEAGSRYVINEWLWKDKIKMFHDALETHINDHTPKRLHRNRDQYAHQGAKTSRRRQSLR